MTAPGSAEPTSIGRYELSSTLGVGGFASVHRAHDPALDGDVALKILLPQFSADDDIRHRFLQEARLLRRVDSPNVVRVYDIGELEDGRPYFVMELAEGGVLSQRVRPPVDLPSLRRIVDALANGLGALHGANIVHRDIKPDNLLIAGQARGEQTHVGNDLLLPGERVLIGDLGLAKDQERTTAGPTVSGGTPFYRPPEQMTPGAPITAAADIYAATGLVWYLLTGNHPPETDAVPAQVPSLPAPWQPLLERGLDRDPMLRHATIEEWAAEADRAMQAAPETGFDTVAIGDAGTLCPYKGMAAFQPEDAGLFFGRDDLIDTLVARMQDHSVLVIGGPSGSGKSSLVRAGLLPRLSRGAIAGSQQWRVGLFTPGSDAVGELVHQLRRLRAVPSDVTTTTTTEANGPVTGPTPQLTRGPQPPAPDEPAPLPTLAPLAEICRDDLPHGARRWLDDGPSTLLVIDQFEELFTLNDSKDEQRLFLDTLASMTESVHSRIKVVIALRADFYGECAGHPWLNDRINESQLLVGPMSRQELREAITMPAKRAGLRLEDGLADTILDDVGPGGGALPLLGHALMETWIRRRGSQLTLEGYEGAGGVSGAIAQRADEVCHNLAEGEQEAAHNLLLQLINPGEGTPDTRRRVAIDALSPHPHLPTVMEKLASARLLTVHENSVELIHEALIQSWPLLREWIDDNRESLQARRRIAAAATEWDAQDRNSDLLYRGTQLASALDWLAANPDLPDPCSVDFLTEARDVRDRAEEERAAAEARGRRNRRRAIAALGTLAAAAVVASFVAFVALGRSQANEQAAERQQVQALAAAASANAAEQPILATGLALESIARSTPSSAQARAALVEARVGLDDGRLLPQPFGRPVNVGDMLSVAITTDGARFVTGARNGDVVFWDRVTRTELYRIDVHDSGVKSLTASSDGRWLLSSGNSKVVLWDLGAEPPEPILLHEFDRVGADTIWDVGFSPDSRLAAVATENDGVLLFDRAARRLIGSAMAGDQFDILSVTFIDNGRLAAGDGAGNLHMVDATTGALIGNRQEAGARGTDVWELVPNAEGDVLFTVSADHAIRAWDVGDDGLAERMGMSDPDISNPSTVIPSEDGSELVVGAADGRIHRIGLDGTGLSRQGASPALHADDVIDLSRSANGWLVSLGDDQRAQVWRHAGDLEVLDAALVESEPIVDLALSPDANLLAAASEGGTGLYEAISGSVVHWFDGAVDSVAFVGDDRVVTGSPTGVVRLWDASRGALIAENAAHGGSPVRSIVGSPDGSMVASGGVDGSVVLWSADDLVEVRALDGHPGEVTGLDFSGDDMIVSVGWDRSLRWSPIDGSEGRSITLDQDGPQTLAVHPDGELVAIGGSEEKIDLLDGDGALIRSMAPHSGGVWDVAFTADGLSIIGTSRGTGELQLWDTATGERLGPAFGGDRIEPDVVTGPGGMIWSSGLDGGIRQLDVLVTEVGCRLSVDVLNEALRDQFLSGATLQSCQVS